MFAFFVVRRIISHRKNLAKKGIKEPEKKKQVLTKIKEKDDKKQDDKIKINEKSKKRDMKRATKKPGK